MVGAGRSLLPEIFGLSELLLIAIPTTAHKTTKSVNQSTNSWHCAFVEPG